MSDDDHEPSVINVVFPRKLLKKFIALYKELPCLWDRTCAAYKHKHKRHEAITLLTKLVQEHDPTATRVHVLRKIESLRACVRREHKRVRDSRRTAHSPDEIYKPHLWYYDLFSFVFEDGCSNSFDCGFPLKAEGKAEPGPVSEEEEDQPLYEEHTEFEQSLDPSDYAIATSMVEVTDNSKQYSGYEDDPKAKRLCTEVEDEYDAIGINVAAKLRNLPHGMRILAEKLINDVLFQAQINGLNPATVISTPTDPFK
ncbi:alcohol dehydrogenase transcription factor myb/SANT-like domain-containing protein [Phthorimaea operculella]|nr:alcohol dehydrogenase transcription factor myb/SANT-like domain-containing protein [Phthorimaea operculella]